VYLNLIIFTPFFTTFFREFALFDLTVDKVIALHMMQLQNSTFPEKPLDLPPISDFHILVWQL